MEHADADEHPELEDRPPFHSGVGRFGCVPVDAFADYDVGLFVFDLGQEFGELSDWAISVLVIGLS